MASTAKVVHQEDVVTRIGARRALAAMRITLGLYFLWAFIDKLLGLGYATPVERAWINGGTPAQGYLGAVEGPFAGFLSVFINPFGDILFMLALLGIGTALLLGMGLRVAAVSATALLCMMYMSAFPLVNGGTNPLIDSHVFHVLTVIVLWLTRSGDTWGLGRWWASRVGDGWLR